MRCTAFCGPVGPVIGRQPTQLPWRNVIENKRDAVVRAFVHNAVVFLVVYLVGFAHLKLVRAPVDHEADTRIGRNRHVDTMTAVKGWVCVGMWLDLAACQQLGRHRTDDRAAGWIVLADDVMHHGHRDIREPIPTDFLSNFDLGPTVEMCKDENDRLGLSMNIVGYLSMAFFKPIGIVQIGYGMGQWLAVYGTKIANERVYVHSLKMTQ